MARKASASTLTKSGKPWKWHKDIYLMERRRLLTVVLRSSRKIRIHFNNKLRLYFVCHGRVQKLIRENV
jgi:hypothetical protein